MRKTCLDCYRKHVSQAIILLIESRLGYKEHLWLAIGHLAEAESEVLADYYDLAVKTRKERLKIIANPWYNAKLMPLIDEATILDETKTEKRRHR